MDNSKVNHSDGQLPSINTDNSGANASLSNAASPTHAASLSPAQQAQQILSNGSLTPYQMTQQFNELKSQYLQGHGVRIGD